MVSVHIMVSTYHGVCTSHGASTYNDPCVPSVVVGQVFGVLRFGLTSYTQTRVGRGRTEEGRGVVGPFGPVSLL